MRLRFYQDGDMDAIVNEKAADGSCVTSLLEGGINFTATDNGVPVACGGVLKTGEAWLSVDEKMDKAKLVRILAVGKRIIEQEFDFPIWCRVRTGFEQGERLARHFGLTPSETEVIMDKEYRTWK